MYCKRFHIFQKKTCNETLTNDAVNLEQPAPDRKIKVYFYCAHALIKGLERVSTSHTHRLSDCHLRGSNFLGEK